MCRWCQQRARSTIVRLYGCRRVVYYALLLYYCYHILILNIVRIPVLCIYYVLCYVRYLWVDKQAWLGSEPPLYLYLFQSEQILLVCGRLKWDIRLHLQLPESSRTVPRQPQLISALLLPLLPLVYWTGPTDSWDLTEPPLAHCESESRCKHSMMGHR